MIGHLLRVTQSYFRELTKPRSPEWSKVRDAFLQTHPTCAACGGLDILQVHHKAPFHLDPELELEPKNLVTLCMSTFECHLRIGHGGNWDAYNPRVELDAAEIARHPERRAQIETTAKMRRLTAPAVESC